MTAVAHDVRRRSAAGGLALALLSAVSFGLSGALASGLIVAGWSPGAAVSVRILLAAGVLLWPALRALDGRWSLLARNLPTLVGYGLLAVAGAQLCYFYAVAHLQVGVALLIEYTAPVAVVAWLWLRRGERPGVLMLAGAGVAAVGLVLVLDLVSGADVNLVGALWALGAMVGAATYFVVSADETNGLPPLVLAAGGLCVAAVALLVAAAVGVLPMAVASVSPTYAGRAVPWWLPVLALGLVTAALAYTTGIAAGRRLGSRLASFVALSEVLAALVFAWLLLDQVPRTVQLAGGALVVAGVVLVKLAEPTSAPTSPKASLSGRPAA
ncbi:EamA family transporter [Nocardioides terrisoli]|uniref:EamA family transporter n=1 Tax=Nocardioides terrisoli TaxID=3388267 RepID=UPI00287B88DC|nr:EamA family transporter [Nocardioides marmorisolisilvae]